MDIKFAREGRVAQYGIALGVLLYAVWRGLAWFFTPRNSTRPTCAARGMR